MQKQHAGEWGNTRTQAQAHDKKQRLSGNPCAATKQGSGQGEARPGPLRHRAAMPLRERWRWQPQALRDPPPPADLAPWASQAGDDLPAEESEASEALPLPQ